MKLGRYYRRRLDAIERFELNEQLGRCFRRVENTLENMAFVDVSVEVSHDCDDDPDPTRVRVVVHEHLPLGDNDLLSARVVRALERARPCDLLSDDTDLRRHAADLRSDTSRDADADVVIA